MGVKGSTFGGGFVFTMHVGYTMLNVKWYGKVIIGRAITLDPVVRGTRRFDDMGRDKVVLSCAFIHRSGTRVLQYIQSMHDHFIGQDG